MLFIHRHIVKEWVMLLDGVECNTENFISFKKHFGDHLSLYTIYTVHGVLVPIKLYVSTAKYRHGSYIHIKWAGETKDQNLYMQKPTRFWYLYTHTVNKYIYSHSIRWMGTTVIQFVFFPVCQCMFLLNENTKKLHKMYIVDCCKSFPFRGEYLRGILTKHKTREWDYLKYYNTRMLFNLCKYVRFYLQSVLHVLLYT